MCWRDDDPVFAARVVAVHDPVRREPPGQARAHPAFGRDAHDRALERGQVEQFAARNDQQPFGRRVRRILGEEPARVNKAPGPPGPRTLQIYGDLPGTARRRVVEIQIAPRGVRDAPPTRPRIARVVVGVVRAG